MKLCKIYLIPMLSVSVVESSLKQHSSMSLCPQPSIPSCLARSIICLLPASRWVHCTVGHQPVVGWSFSCTFLVFIKSSTLSHTDDDIPRELTCETLALFRLTIAWQSDSSAVLHNSSAGCKHTAVHETNKADGKGLHVCHRASVTMAIREQALTSYAFMFASRLSSLMGDFLS